MDKVLKCQFELMPGVWVDTNNALHVSIPDLIRHFGLENTEANRCEVEKIAQRVIRKEMPDVKFVAVGSCVNCGAHGNERHAEDCPLR